MLYGRCHLAAVPEHELSGGWPWPWASAVSCRQPGLADLPAGMQAVTPAAGQKGGLQLA